MERSGVQVIETQWEVSTVSDLRSCVICCCWFTVFIKSKVTAAVFSLSDLQVAQNKEHGTCAKSLQTSLTVFTMRKTTKVNNRAVLHGVCDMFRVVGQVRGWANK